MIANQLRIGNLVAYGVRPVPIKSIHTESVLKKEVHVYVELNENLIHYCIDVSEVKPIPLTEEWLLKFGFHKKDAEWYLHPCFELKIIVFNKGEFNGVMFYTRTIHTDFTPIYCTKHINHVHQLQNLYFALTGEELTYGGNK
jgi:hypothetical protein